MRKNNRSQQPFYRINVQISARELRVLDETGKQIGLLSREEALKTAQDQELDLVEIAPNANPPVAKVIDYSKFLYQLKKKKQEEKRTAKVSETKQIQSGPFIDDHDLGIKVKKAREFIEDGDKVRFVIRFKGRELGRKEIGEEVTKKAIAMLSDIAKVERETKMEGRQMVTVFSRLKPGENKKETVEENHVTTVENSINQEITN